MKRFDEWFTRTLMYFYMRCYERLCDYRLKKDMNISLSKHDVIVMGGRRQRHRPHRR